MCGIACIYQFRHAAKVDHDELTAISDAMEARGPDASGIWFSADCCIGLAHRRLSIIDLSEQGAQPMASADGGIIVSFNGEIYNYRQLRTELESKGHRFRSHSDTEVLLHLYAEKGIGMLNDLRGMFAFALWDTREERLYLARDPYGIKPLYYTKDEHAFRAASQIRALRAGGKISRQFESAAVAGFFLLGSVPEPWTIYKGVMALPAGTYLRVDRQGIADPVSYCDIGAVLAEASRTSIAIAPDEAQEMIASALRDSVMAHMVADVPIGLFLSSGIDSGALAGVVAQEGLTLETLTLGFNEYTGTADDEIPMATKLASYYNMRHQEVNISRADFMSALPKILMDMDQPSIDGINTWLVSRAAAGLGWKVAISGVGGDELFGGYSSFHDIPRWMRLFYLPSRLPVLPRAFHAIFSRVAADVPALSPKFASMPRYTGNFAGAYLLKRGLFLPEELPTVMGHDESVEGLSRLNILATINRPLNGHEWRRDGFAVSAMESSLYMRNQLLRDADWAGMAHSLEIRTPLVDVNLLKKIVPALASIGHRQDKQPLELVRSLPKEFLHRKKTGFTVPIENWLQKDSRLDAWRQIPSLRRDRCPWARRWAYTVLHHWESEF